MLMSMKIVEPALLSLEHASKRSLLWNLTSLKLGKKRGRDGRAYSCYRVT